MGKIIDINNNDGIVIIGENGAVSEVRLDDLNFVPIVGDEVEVFKSETKTYVTKVQKVETILGQDHGININLQNTQTAPNTYIATGKVVSKLAYCLLAFFLGGIGAHKFYAGKIGTGIIYLLFCWTFIPALLAFIDFIIGLCKHSDANGNIIV